MALTKVWRDRPAELDPLPGETPAEHEARIDAYAVANPGVLTPLDKAGMEDLEARTRTELNKFSVLREAPINALSPPGALAPATGDGSSDDYAALMAMINALPPRVGGEIFLPPPSVGYRVSDPLRWFDRPVHLRALVACNSVPGPADSSGTKLIADPGKKAIIVENGPNGWGSRSLIENLHLINTDTVAGANHGMTLRANAAKAMGCKVEGFGGHGIYVLSGSDADPNTPEGQFNANKWAVQDCRASNNKRSGLRVHGVDSNAGYAIGFDASFNGEDGIYDSSPLGNAYYSPHLDGNVLNAIHLGSGGGSCRFYGVYKEGTAHPALLIDAGNGGRNLVDFRVLTGLAGQAITDNSATRTNQITTGPTQGDRDNAQPGLVAGPAWAGPSAIALSASTMFVARFVPSRLMKLTKISFAVTTAAAFNDACDVGIYDSAGTRLISLGATTGLLNSTGVKTVTLSTPAVVKAGVVHYVALSCGTQGGAAAQLLGRSMFSALGSAIFGATLGNVEIGFYSATHPCPVSVGLTPAANNSGPMMVARED